jgi:hypothetical protein
MVCLLDPPPYGFVFIFSCLTALSFLIALHASCLHLLPPHGTLFSFLSQKFRLRTMRRSIDVCDVTSLASHVINIIT